MLSHSLNPGQEFGHRHRSLGDVASMAARDRIFDGVAQTTINPIDSIVFNRVLFSRSNLSVPVPISRDGADVTAVLARHEDQIDELLSTEFPLNTSPFGVSSVITEYGVFVCFTGRKRHSLASAVSRKTSATEGAAKFEVGARNLGLIPAFTSTEIEIRRPFSPAVEDRGQLHSYSQSAELLPNEPKPSGVGYLAFKTSAASGVIRQKTTLFDPLPRPTFTSTSVADIPATAWSTDSFPISEYRPTTKEFSRQVNYRFHGLPVRLGLEHEGNS